MDIQIDEDARREIRNAGELATRAKDFEITTPEAEIEAAEWLRRIKAKTASLEDTRKSLTRPLDESKRRIMDLFRDPLDKLRSAEATIKRAIGQYRAAEERRQQEEQRRAEERARKERERLERRAAKAEESGKEEKAEELRGRAETVTAPLVTAPSKPRGVSTREVWKFEIVKPAEIPREFLTPDEKKIGAVVRALKGDANIPGVRIYRDTTVAARRA